MTAREIIEKYLKDNGYDGLCNSDVECGCDLDELAPCDSNMLDCEPAYKHICTDEEMNKHAVDEDCNSDCCGECFKKEK
jgi:hypothetical protein